MNERFVLHHDGQWFYYLAAETRQSWPGPAVPHADGQPMTEIRDGWWVTDHEADTVTVHKPRRPKTTGYLLRDLSAASEKFPATLTPGEWEQRSDAEEIFCSLYDRVTEDQPAEVVTVEGPWVRLDGEPAPADGRTWVANLPHALKHRPEYRHLFAGYLTGFRAHVKAMAEKHPFQQFVFDGYQGKPGIFVTLQVPFDQPVTTYEPALNRDGSVSRSRSGRHVQVKATRRLHFDVPDRIPGATRAEAVAKWEQLTAEYTQALDEASVKACAACRGHGYVIDGAENYERPH